MCNNNVKICNNRAIITVITGNNDATTTKKRSDWHQVLLEIDAAAQPSREGDTLVLDSVQTSAAKPRLLHLKRPVSLSFHACGCAILASVFLGDSKLWLCDGLICSYQRKCAHLRVLHRRIWCMRSGERECKCSLFWSNVCKPVVLGCCQCVEVETKTWTSVPGYRHSEKVVSATAASSGARYWKMAVSRFCSSSFFWRFDPAKNPPKDPSPGLTATADVPHEEPEQRHRAEGPVKQQCEQVWGEQSTCD